MNYVLYGVLAYLALGIFLTRSILMIAPTIRTRFRDYAVGAVLMPVLLLFALLLSLFEKLWARLLIALDYEPPENMRAGPDAPAKHDSGDT